jgi:maltose alpha-D-glucosyltransferase/alpha-amylase
MQHGRIRAKAGAILSELRAQGGDSVWANRGFAEKTNCSILYSEKFVITLFRRYEAGLNSDAEIGKYLTEEMHFDGILPFAGSMEYVPEHAEAASLGLLQAYVPNEGDGWKWTVEELGRYYENCAAMPLPAQDTPGERADIFESSEQPTAALARDHLGIYLESAATLGRRTAQMHLALASPTTNPAFSPEPMTVEDLQSLVAELRERATHAFDVLKESLSRLPDDVVECAGLVLGRRRVILDYFKGLDWRRMRPLQTRIHGNYHLGNVLRAKTDYIIIDFEGKRASSPVQRRGKQTPIKDVAGMLRSFSYAVYATLMDYTARRPEDLASLIPWARFWEHSVGGAFLRAYRETAGNGHYLPTDPHDFRQLLQTYLMDQALHELVYELENRPAWVRIPLEGILSFPL